MCRVPSYQYVKSFTILNIIYRKHNLATVCDCSVFSVLIQVCSASLRVKWRSCCWPGAKEPDWGSLTPKACTTWGCRPTKPSFRSRLNAYWSCSSWLSRSTKPNVVFPGKTSCYSGRHDWGVLVCVPVRWTAALSKKIWSKLLNNVSLFVMRSKTICPSCVSGSNHCQHQRTVSHGNCVTRKGLVPCGADPRAVWRYDGWRKAEQRNT